MIYAHERGEHKPMQLYDGTEDCEYYEKEKIKK